MAKRKGKQVSLWLPEELVNAFAAHAEKMRRTFKAELEIAMEERMAKFGRWEPPDTPENGGRDARAEGKPHGKRRKEGGAS